MGAGIKNPPNGAEGINLTDRSQSDGHDCSHVGFIYGGRGIWSPFKSVIGRNENIQRPIKEGGIYNQFHTQVVFTDSEIKTMRKSSETSVKPNRVGTTKYVDKTTRS